MVSNELLEQAAREVFLYLGFNFEVNLSFLTDLEMKKLNKTFKGKSALTNVLSFNHEEGEPHGDIAISETVVSDEAINLGYSKEELILLYLVHGIFHLVGFDHKSDKDRAKMEKAEKEIFSRIGISIDRD